MSVALVAFVPLVDAVVVSKEGRVVVTTCTYVCILLLPFLLS